MESKLLALTGTATRGQLSWEAPVLKTCADVCLRLRCRQPAGAGYWRFCLLRTFARGRVVRELREQQGKRTSGQGLVHYQVP